jgi:hypothetical protein
MFNWLAKVNVPSDWDWKNDGLWRHSVGQTKKSGYNITAMITGPLGTGLKFAYPPGTPMYLVGEGLSTVSKFAGFKGALQRKMNQESGKHPMTNEITQLKRNLKLYNYAGIPFAGPALQVVSHGPKVLKPLFPERYYTPLATTAKVGLMTYYPTR